MRYFNMLLCVPTPRRSLAQWVSVIAVVCLTMVGWSGEVVPPPLALTADEVMQKALQRAETLPTRDARSQFIYTKHTVKEDMDNKGKVKDREEKVYEVSVTDGLSYLKLLQLNGQNLSAAELKKEEEREAAERQKMQDAKPANAKGDNRENFLTAELVGKYNYTLGDKIVFHGRNSYVINFEPKPNLPVHKLSDRFANEIAGLAYIDAEDFEIAHAEIHLKGEVALWGGLVGTLRHCRFTIERTRTPEGIWFNSSSHGIFEGRKLMEPMMIRTHSESTNFHRPTLAME